MSGFMPVPYCFDYFSFVIYFQVRRCDTSSFTLLSQDCCGYFGSFAVIYGFGDYFSISVKNATGILVGMALNL